MDYNALKVSKSLNVCEESIAPGNWTRFSAFKSRVSTKQAKKIILAPCLLLVLHEAFKE